jgi:hypothetical protein
MAEGLGCATYNLTVSNSCTVVPTATATGTPTITNTPTQTRTPTPTNTPCGGVADYAVSTATATIISGTHNIGFDEVSLYKTIPLPFPFQLYDRTFNEVTVGEDGSLQFLSINSDYNVCLPHNEFDFAILPYWAHVGIGQPGTGVFTSVLGTAPSRTFVIEWRGTHDSTSVPVNFEVLLYENAPNQAFDFIYGELGGPGFDGRATIGVQWGTGERFTQVACRTRGVTEPGRKLSFTLPQCEQTTNTPTRTSTSTPTGTATANCGLAWRAVDAANPELYGNRFHGVDAASQNSAWAVGYTQVAPMGGKQALVQRWDGGSWRVVTVPHAADAVEEQLSAVSVLSEMDAWAVGHYYTGTGAQRPLTMRWNGTAWSVVASPIVGSGRHELRSVTAISANDAWAVGTYMEGNVRRTLTMHWDGTAWAVVASPNRVGGENWLNGVAYTAANDVWAVGAGVNDTLVLRWNGTAWAMQTTPRLAEDDLTAVVAIAANDVWAVGRSGGSFAIHWDGAAWDIMPIVLPGATNTRFRAIAATGPNELWVAGSGIMQGQVKKVIAQYDGTSWSQVASPETGWTNESFLALASVGGEMWAAGYTGESGTSVLVERYSAGCVTTTATATATGTPACQVGWHRVAAPQPSTNTVLEAVEAISTNDVWAAGYTAVSGTFATFFQHWNGAEWTTVPSPSGGNAGHNPIKSISAVNAGDVWAVGSYGEFFGTARTTTLHWNGSAWSIVPSPNVGTGDNNLFGVSAVSANDVWAVGRAGANVLILRWNGTAWSVVPTSQAGQLYSVTAFSANDVWAVGSDAGQPLTMRWDGTIWSRVATPARSGAGLYSVHGSGPDDVWAVGAYSTFSVVHSLILHWDGTAWTMVEGAPLFTRLHGVSVISESDAWAVGSSSEYPQRPVLLHWNGTAWRFATNPQMRQDSQLNAVASVSHDDVWAVGHGPREAGNTGTLIEHYTDANCPAPTATPTNTPTRTATNTGTVTRTPTPTNTGTVTNTPTRTYTATAQPSCGQAANYAVTRTTGATMVPAGNLVAGTQCYNCSVRVNLPFTYNLYGQNFNSVSIGSNGYLGFTGSESYDNSCLLNNRLDYAIMPHWDLLDTRTSTAPGLGVYTSTTGTAPNRIYNVEWRSCLYSSGSCGGNVNFQVRLYESLDRFDVIYGSVAGLGESATVGVQRKLNGEQYTQYSCNMPVLAPGVQLRFEQPLCPTGTPATSTPSTVPTNTPSAVPTTCTDNYRVTVSNRPIVTGTLDIGNSCNNCFTQITLPFTYTFYGQNFTTARVESNGQLAFGIEEDSFTGGCIVESEASYTFFPHWDDLYTTFNLYGCGSYPNGRCGIFTSTTGTAPNRIHNIEWRAVRHDSSRVNFTVQLFEGQTRLDVTYGEVSNIGRHASVGAVKAEGDLNVQYSCDQPILYPTLSLSFNQYACPTATPCPSCPTITQTATRTSTTGPTNTSTRTPGTPTATRTPQLGDANWDTRFESNGLNDVVYSVAISGTNVFAGGNFTGVGEPNFGSPANTQLNNVARWDGNSWSPLGTGVNGTVYAVAVRGDDVYVGGNFTQAGGEPARNIAKWNSVTGQWSAFGTGADESVYALAVHGGNVYAAGAFNQINLTPANFIARWNGTAWFALGSGTNGFINAVVVNPANGELYVGGGFDRAGGSTASYVARWDGTSWSPLGTGTNSYVNALHITGSDLYVGGIFSRAGGETANKIARWSITNAAWSALGTGTSGDINAITSSGNDIYAGGGYGSAGGVEARRVAKWNTVSNTWTNLGSGLQYRNNSSLGEAFALAAVGDDIYVGGKFTLAGNKNAYNFSIWHDAPVPTATITPTSGPTDTPANTSTRTSTRTVTSTATSTNTATNTATATPVISLNGHVTWEGRPAQPNPLQAQPITLVLRQGEQSHTFNATTNASGQFTVVVGNLPAGTYSWWAKGPQYLAKSGSVTLTGAPSTSLEIGLMKTGDANNDNRVSAVDASIVRQSLGKRLGDPGYDARADFNGDNTVNGQDQALMQANFGQAGVPQSGGLPWGLMLGLLRKAGPGTRKRTGRMNRKLAFTLIALMLVAMVGVATSNSALGTRSTTRTYLPQMQGPAGSVAGSNVAAPDEPGTQLKSRVVPSEKNDTSPPLRSIPAARATIEGQKVEGPENMPVPWGRAGAIIDPIVQVQQSTQPMPTPIANFEGIPFRQSYPPDPNGDVGPNHYVQWVNKEFQIFTKTGTSVYGPAAGNTLWTGFGGPCETENDGDPIVQYDPLAGRWLMSQFSISSGYYQCIAISLTSDPTSSYHRYAFRMSNTQLNDYPKFGIWPDAYYMSIVNFSGGATYSGPAAVAFDRAKMLAGQPASFQQFQLPNTYLPLLPADLDGRTPPPAGAPNTFVTIAPPNTLQLWKFHVDWTNPQNTTFTGPTHLVVQPYNVRICDIPHSCINQPNNGHQLLDANTDRPMYRLAYRNYGTHESLVFNHTVGTEDIYGFAAPRWYELRNVSSNSPTVHQQGTFGPNDETERWMGSIAMDAVGNMALGYSVSSDEVYPGIRYTGRLATDPPGVMTFAEGSIKEGGGVQQGTHRWGDYTSLSVDPVDDCTFWYTSEYYPETSSYSWRTRIASFKFPNCTPNGTATPTATRAPSQTATATATNTPVAANAFAQLVPGGHMTVSLGSKFALDLNVNAGSNRIVAAQQYMTFTHTILQNVTAGGPSCAPSNAITSDTTSLETVLQNEVCNGGQPCDFGGATAPPGSIAYASAAFQNAPRTGNFRVARLAFCANTAGRAVVRWELPPSSRPDRQSEIADVNSQVVSNPALYANMIIDVVGGATTPTATSTSTSVPTSTATVTSVPSSTSTRTSTSTSTTVPTATMTTAPSATPSSTNTATATNTRTATTAPANTATRTSTVTSTMVPATATRTNTSVPPSATQASTQTATRTATRTGTATNTVAATATRTSTRTVSPTPCTACGLQVTSVQISCNNNGTTSWRATVRNTSACDVQANYALPVVVTLNNRQVRIVTIETGTATFRPGSNLVRGDICFDYSPNTSSVQAYFVAGRDSSCITSGQSNVMAPCPGTPQCQLTFTDVKPEHEYYNDAAALKARGAVPAAWGAELKAETSITRGELAEVVVKAFNLTIDTKGGPHFSDVPTTSPYYRYIETAFNKGLLNGYRDGTFGPEKAVTRGQLAKIAVQAADLPTVAHDKPAFSDVKADSAFYAYVETAVASGLMSGYDDGTFRPDKEVTRGEAARIIMNACPSPLAKLPESALPLFMPKSGD